MCILITLPNSLNNANITRASSSRVPASKVIRYYFREGGIVSTTEVQEVHDVVSGRHWLLKKWSRVTAKEEIGAKVAGSCLKAAVYFIAYFSRSVHPCMETDMVVFEALL